MGISRKNKQVLNQITYVKIELVSDFFIQKTFPRQTLELNLCVLHSHTRIRIIICSEVTYVPGNLIPFTGC